MGAFQLSSKSVQHERPSRNGRSFTNIQKQAKKYEVIFGMGLFFENLKLKYIFVNIVRNILWSLGPTFSGEPSYFENASGVVETVSSNVVVIKFFDGFTHRMAKFYPGSMYINGQISLASVIKGNFFHAWPDYIK